uniref:Uncharacterized protein n=1 Tax=Glossina austeni TaxID=7395 RepID=A0A1A9V308_GLOAU
MPIRDMCARVCMPRCAWISIVITTASISIVVVDDDDDNVIADPASQPASHLSSSSLSVIFVGDKTEELFMDSIQDIIHSPDYTEHIDLSFCHTCICFQHHKRTSAWVQFEAISIEKSCWHTVFLTLESMIRLKAIGDTTKRDVYNATKSMLGYTTELTTCNNFLFEVFQLTMRKPFREPENVLLQACLLDS